GMLVLAEVAELVPPVIADALRHGLPVMDRRGRGRVLGQAALLAPQARGRGAPRGGRGEAARGAAGGAGGSPGGGGAGSAEGGGGAAGEGRGAGRAVGARSAPEEAGGCPGGATGENPRWAPPGERSEGLPRSAPRPILQRDVRVEHAGEPRRPRRHRL